MIAGLMRVREKLEERIRILHNARSQEGGLAALRYLLVWVNMEIDKEIDLVALATDLVTLATKKDVSNDSNVGNRANPNE